MIQSYSDGCKHKCRMSPVQKCPVSSFWVYKPKKLSIFKSLIDTDFFFGSTDNTFLPSQLFCCILTNECFIKISSISKATVCNYSLCVSDSHHSSLVEESFQVYFKMSSCRRNVRWLFFKLIREWNESVIYSKGNLTVVSHNIKVQSSERDRAVELERADLHACVLYTHDFNHSHF